MTCIRELCPYGVSNMCSVHPMNGRRTALCSPVWICLLRTASASFLRLGMQEEILVQKGR